ncbi:MAG: PD40 domain-containing protein [Bacteroidales bacterium]|nr:PD40 domain-containing protein [Bacteroidales bacterium]MBN2697351.1 PD40 domain-containing protein [Bacteroidales bacterium]
MIRNSFKFIFVFFLAVSFNLPAQRDESRTLFLEAESWFLFEEFAEALDLYLQLHEEDPENDNINYKIGICYLNDPYQKEKSVDYLSRASRNINPFYKENSYKERTAPPEAIYYLANAYLVNNLIDSAIYYYRQFMEILDEEIYDKELVRTQIKCCETARELMKKPVDFDVINLDSLINTRYAEINPVVSGDGRSMVFVYKGPFQDAPYYTTRKDGEWLYPRNLSLELGVDGDVYPTALSYDGTEMFVYRNDDYIGNLYSSTLVDGIWTPIKKLNEHINTKYWESHACLSRDGQTLYFTSNRKGGYGGLDIYRSHRRDKGEWGPPENLGKTINTRYNEETPFITGNDRLLYFSSYGHYNMGGYDIFYAQKVNDSLWAHPINLGYPINTTSDDLFFYPVDNGFGAYYSMYRPEGLGRHDIYHMTVYSDANLRMYMVSGRVNTEGELSDSAGVFIFLIDQVTGDTLYSTQPDKAHGTFQFSLPQGQYYLAISGDNYHDLIRPLHITPRTDKEGIVLTGINLESIPYVPLIFSGKESKIGLKDSLYSGEAGKSVHVPLKLKKGTTLLVEQIVDSVIVQIDTFSVDKKRMNLEVLPRTGTNLIRLRMVEENGDIHLATFVVEGTVPPVPEKAEETPEQLKPARHDTLAETGEITPRFTEETGKPGSGEEIPQTVQKKHTPALLISGISVLLIVFLVLFLWRKRKKKAAN